MAGSAEVHYVFEAVEVRHVRHVEKTTAPVVVELATRELGARGAGAGGAHKILISHADNMRDGDTTEPTFL